MMQHAPARPMSLAIITGDGPEHKYVANRICAAHDVTRIFVCDASPRRKWHKVLTKNPARFVDKTLRKLYLSAIGDAADRQKSLLRVFGASSQSFARSDLVTPVGRPKSGSLLKDIKALKPDIIAVYGTGLIPDDVLGEARVVALNMHTGLSPWYRGTACAFWPILERKPELVGATVHECTAVVDGGRIFFSAPARVFRGDDLHAVFARAVETGAAGYVKVIADAQGGNLHGEAQNLTCGREYKGDMLGISAELAARRALRQMSPAWVAETAR